MDQKIVVAILGMMLVTYLPRMLPLAILTKVPIPPLILDWLKFIPIAVLSALLAPELFMQDSTLSLSLMNPFLLAALPCFAMAIRTRNLFYTVFTGMAAVVLFTHFI